LGVVKAGMEDMQPTGEDGRGRGSDYARGDGLVEGAGRSEHAGVGGVGGQSEDQGDGGGSDEHHMLTVHEFDEWGNPYEDDLVLDMMRRLCPYHTLIVPGGVVPLGARHSDGEGPPVDELKSSDQGANHCYENKVTTGTEGGAVDGSHSPNKGFSPGGSMMPRIIGSQKGMQNRPLDIGSGADGVDQVVNPVTPSGADSGNGGGGTRSQGFPAVYLTAGLRDARVPFWMPVKYAAAVRHAWKGGVGGGPTVVLQFSGDAGHFSQGLMGGDVGEAAEQLAFLLTSVRNAA
jgi:hypothetical protein